MRIAAFVVFAILTIGLVAVLDMPLKVRGNKTPRLGSFLSPQEGFWQNAEPVNTAFNADLTFPGLQGKTDVYFDERLVPHIYAEQENDAYFVQGYLHAKFRLWQMEFQTHAAAGRLSEIVGSQFLKTDQYFRRIGMPYAAEKSLRELEADPITKSETDAYTAGVNAYISSLQPNQIPFEYKLLDYKPEKWTNLKTSLFLKYMSFSLAGGDRDFEMTNAKSIFSYSDIEKLYPTTQDSLDPILPKGTLFAPASETVSSPANVDSVYYPHIDSTADPLVIMPDKNNGSNNWVVAGSKTQSGAPILCNDPHLGLNLPALWYEMQITTPTFSSYGVSFPGAPSIIIGFNDSCAWGVTNAGRDVKDYYEIQFRDSTMQEYMYNGIWTKAGVREEVIKVKGGANDVQKIAMTVFGPVMYDHSYPNILKNGKYYALRWKAHDASNELLTFNKLNHARNFVDYIKAISLYQTPGQNFAFASRSGDIAIREQGMFPVKWRRQGDFLMPGTDSSYSWQGYIPARENPTMYNPERGFLSSANQLATDETYPYYLGGIPEIFRGLQINRMLGGMNNITIEDMQRMQTDNYNRFAEMARSVMLKYINQSEFSASERVYLNDFKNWNLRSDIGEKGPVVFKLWWDSLMTGVYGDEFARTELPVRWPDESTLLESLIKDSAYKFADDIKTPAVEGIADIVTRSYKAALKELKVLDKKQLLTWGKFKDTGVRHLLKLPGLSRLHLPIGGGSNIINAAIEGHGPSWRMIVQMSDNIEAYGVYPGGQSGNPGSKYYDNFVDSWTAGKYYPLLFLKQQNAKQNGAIKWTITFSKA